MNLISCLARLEIKDIWMWNATTVCSCAPVWSSYHSAPSQEGSEALFELDARPCLHACALITVTLHAQLFWFYCTNNLGKKFFLDKNSMMTQIMSAMTLCSYSLSKDKKINCTTVGFIVSSQLSCHFIWHVWQVGMTVCGELQFKNLNLPTFLDHFYRPM